MTFDNKTDEYYFNNKLKGIRKGIYYFRDIIRQDWTEEIEKILLKEYVDGTATEQVKKALVDYYTSEITLQKKTINDVPEEIRDYISQIIKENENILN